MSTSLSRRELLAASAAALGAGLVTSEDVLAASEPESGSSSGQLAFQYCLNTSTVRGHKLSVPEQISLAAEAGYTGIEPWIRDLQQYVDGGGKASDLKKQLDDSGLRVDSAIGFAKWIVDDADERAKGLEQAKRDMDLLKQVGGVRIAAPPTGATNGDRLPIAAMAERYAKLCEVGHDAGIVPQLEVWGFSVNLSRLGESTAVAIESGHPDACLLPDVYHIYKGGTDFTGLQLIAGSGIHCLHMNDYPGTPGRETIKDADRVYPGEGIAPLDFILQTMHRNGFEGVLSLELFNPTYWKQDAKLVAKRGLERMQAAVTKAFRPVSD